MVMMTETLPWYSVMMMIFRGVMTMMMMTMMMTDTDIDDDSKRHDNETMVPAA